MNKFKAPLTKKFHQSKNITKLTNLKKLIVKIIKVSF